MRNLIRTGLPSPRRALHNATVFTMALRLPRPCRRERSQSMTLEGQTQPKHRRIPRAVSPGGEICASVRRESPKRKRGPHSGAPRTAGQRPARRSASHSSQPRRKKPSRGSEESLWKASLVNRTDPAHALANDNEEKCPPSSRRAAPLPNPPPLQPSNAALMSTTLRRHKVDPQNRAVTSTQRIHFFIKTQGSAASQKCYWTCLSSISVARFPSLAGASASVPPALPSALAPRSLPFLSPVPKGQEPLPKGQPALPRASLRPLQLRDRRKIRPTSWYTAERRLRMNARAFATEGRRRRLRRRSGAVGEARARATPDHVGARQEGRAAGREGGRAGSEPDLACQREWGKKVCLLLPPSPSPPTKEKEAKPPPLQKRRKSIHPPNPPPQKEVNPPPPPPQTTNPSLLPRGLITLIAPLIN
ncbi:hypothetical protein C7M84_020214 [Penaeus vannamei]|uniref:Uncharacterized protein n=1 Tax=Penaeus vannamei TaxID=6689 RepID=A0A423SCS3_PENVA|nr:hypothetical protein C7M84_020214 [Penaeus vannamei]